ncbi:hypothetical protein, partial [Seonamhaeicola marinus]|uniref:hypothetical protein n=1 Tax=Seonamhaeicola marinus TaxID=1912246 RepID=UPI001CA309FA
MCKFLTFFFGLFLNKLNILRHLKPKSITAIKAPKKKINSPYQNVFDEIIDGSNKITSSSCCFLFPKKTSGKEIIYS